MAPQGTPDTHTEPFDTAKTVCIDACLDCVKACEACMSACLAAPEMMETTNECVRRATDTVEICVLCARLLARGSDLALAVCVMCAAAAERCAEECQKLADHDLCQACSSACVTCADACRELAQRVANPVA